MKYKEFTYEITGKDVSRVNVVASSHEVALEFLKENISSYLTISSLVNEKDVLSPRTMQRLQLGEKPPFLSPSNL